MNYQFQKRPKRILFGAFIATLAMFLVACSPSDSGKQAIDLVDTGKEIPQVNVGLSATLSNLYIGQESGANNYWIAANVQEGLVGIDPDGSIVPALATEWTMPDETTYVFKLRDNAVFQNGDPMKPEDVIFSLQMAADPTLSPGTASYLASFQSATVTGPNEITVTTNRPDASFLMLLSSAGAFVVTEQSFWEANNGNVGTSESLLMGTGPYKVVEFSPDSHVTLERVDTWWGGVPKAKEINVEFIPDENTRLVAAQKGDLDIALQLPLKQLSQWEKIKDGRTTADLNSLTYTGIFFDQNAKPFDDPKVRQAVAYAIDTNVLVEKVIRGNGQVASAIMAPDTMVGLGDKAKADKLLSENPQYNFDLAKAKAALKESSVPEGFTTEITYPNVSPELGTAALAIAENLKEIGITLKVKEVPLEEWLSTLGDGKRGMGFMMYFSTTPDPGAVSSYLLGPGNPANVNDSAVEELINKAGAETDPAARIEILMQLEKLSAEAAYNAPLWWGETITYLSNNVGLSSYAPYAFDGPWAAKLFAAAPAK